MELAINAIWHNCSLSQQAREWLLNELTEKAQHSNNHLNTDIYTGKDINIHIHLANPCLQSLERAEQLGLSLMITGPKAHIYELKTVEWS